MKIAVCDDDRFYRENIPKLLNLYSERNPQYEISFTVFSHADDLLSVSRKIGGFDIYILDVIMPDENGIELGIKLRNNRFDGKIIFLTSSEDFVFDSFKAQAFDYILKPVEAEILFSVLDSAAETISYKKEKSIIVKSADGNLKLAFDRIMYAELINRSVHFHLTNGKTIESISVRTSFADAVKELIDDDSFVLCGASFVINLLHITETKTKELVFRNGRSIQLSRKMLAELRAKWVEYWLIEQGDV